MYDYVIVGAGFAGAVMAERLACQQKKTVLIIEKRGHIGGNAYDEFDEYGILVHRYGPHIFHTNNREVFEYLSRFTEWQFYEHKVLAKHNNELYPIPINRITINKLYGTNLKTDNDTIEFLQNYRIQRAPILNSEDKIVDLVGEDLFNRFFKNYTKKQWGMEPKKLSPAVCGRIPVRYNEDCRYFTDKYQYMPKEGYSKMFYHMLNHRNIDIMLNTDYKTILENIKFNRLIYTGLIDDFFDFNFGRLPYRSIRFEFENFPFESYQGMTQINYVDENEKYTRIIEHKFLNGHKQKTTTISREYPQNGGEPYYPILTEENIKKYRKYRRAADKLQTVTFCGRLAEYNYFNMDQVIARALNCFMENVCK